VASKAGVVGLTRELAAQWGRRGIRVNAIAPGYFPTEMTGLLEDQEQVTLDPRPHRPRPACRDQRARRDAALLGHTGVDVSDRPDSRRRRWLVGVLTYRSGRPSSGAVARLLGADGGCQPRFAGMRWRDGTDTGDRSVTSTTCAARIRALATDSDSRRLLPHPKGLRVDAEHRPASAVESISNIAHAAYLLRTRTTL
jgi:hypothetical protein